MPFSASSFRIRRRLSLKSLATCSAVHVTEAAQTGAALVLAGRAAASAVARACWLSLSSVAAAAATAPAAATAAAGAGPPADWAHSDVW